MGGKRKAIKDLREEDPKTRRLIGEPIATDDARGLEFYCAHVRSRMTLPFVVWLGVVRLHAMHGAKISTGMFTDTAAGQVGTGIRHGSTRRDAAHMMNTTYVPQTGAKVPNQARVQEFLRLSRATTQQTQRANVSSDKVIDSVQTIYKNKILSRYATSPPKAPDYRIDRQEILNWIVEYRAELLKRLKATSAKIKDPNKKKWYTAAIDRIKDCHPPSLAYDIHEEIHDDR